jgi:glucan phosphoethanolaminetransferase (alkaline phosphatase superfamily)
MSTLQDEMAALNHRLEHKLDTLRRLRRLHKAIGLFLLYVFLLVLIVLLFFRQQPSRVNESLLIAILITVMLPLIYCWFMFFVFRSQLNKGQELKKSLYKSFLYDEANRNMVINYHNDLEGINW